MWYDDIRVTCSTLATSTASDFIASNQVHTTLPCSTVIHVLTCRAMSFHVEFPCQAAQAWYAMHCCGTSEVGRGEFAPKISKHRRVSRSRVWNLVITTHFSFWLAWTRSAGRRALPHEWKIINASVLKA